MSLLKCSRFSCGAPCGTSLPHSELWLIDVLFLFMSQSYPMTNDYWFHVRFSCPRSGGHKFTHTTAPSRKGEIRTPAHRGSAALVALPACRLAILLDDKYVLSLAWRPPSLNNLRRCALTGSRGSHQVWKSTSDWSFRMPRGVHSDEQLLNNDL